MNKYILNIFFFLKFKKFFNFRLNQKEISLFFQILIFLSSNNLFAQFTKDSSDSPNIPKLQTKKFFSKNRLLGLSKSNRS